MADFYNKNLIEVRKENDRETFKTVIICIACVILLGIFIYLKTSVFTLVTVSQTSMTNTLNDGDFVVAVKTAEPKRGDIVILYANDKILIKRIVGLEGDVLWSEGGFLYRTTTNENGEVTTEKLIEDYALGRTFMPTKVTVSKGCVYVLGDNREGSVDSRSFGEVSLSDVIGVVPQWSVDIKDSLLVKCYRKLLGY